MLATFPQWQHSPCPDAPQSAALAPCLFRVLCAQVKCGHNSPNRAPVREGALRSRRRIARQSQDCLRMRSLRALGLREQCARLRGLFRPPLHGVFACTETALSAAAPRLRHKTRDCIAQRPAILRTEYRPSAADALRVAFARPAGPRGLAPRRGFPSGSPLSVAQASSLRDVSRHRLQPPYHASAEMPLRIPTTLVGRVVPTRRPRPPAPPPSIHRHTATW